MKKILLIIYLTVTVMFVCSNDAFVTAAGGQINIDENNKNISIEKEDLTIEIKDDYYSVDVVYKFLNNGETVKLKTAFPQYKTLIKSTKGYTISNFKITYGDGRNIDYSFDPTLTEIGNRQYIDGWYLKEIEFNGNTITEIHISYDSVYGAYAGSSRATYLLGTGRSWLGPIKQLNFKIVNRSKKWINRVILKSFDLYKYTNVEDGIYSINLGEHEPDLLETIDILLQDHPTYNDAAVGFYDSYWLDSYIVKDSNLRYLTSDQLRILRNAIYANRGYKFKSKDLSDFFSKQYWYEINNDFTESVFNEIEKKNITKIYNYEYQQREQYIVDVLIENK